FYKLSHLSGIVLVINLFFFVLFFLNFKVGRTPYRYFQERLFIRSRVNFVCHVGYAGEAFARLDQEVGRDFSRFGNDRGINVTGILAETFDYHLLLSLEVKLVVDSAVVEIHTGF
ncbi:hypothetical protein PFISCL1PPCAC_13228, partial [Pristionchus fissidentatus]